jgi:hypothetical protein
MRAHVLASVTQGAAMVAAMGWDRVLLALACIVAVTVLTLANKLDTTAFVAIVGPIAGYVIGAGHEAVKQAGTNGG